MKLLYKGHFWFLVLLITSLLPGKIYAQPCGINTPSFTVNLTGFPQGSWTSPNVVRADQCCGVVPPDRCVEFWITLDPAAVGIRFDIVSGAIPPGALYYEINCTNPTAVGDTMCISGVGPHRITFCKPGNNQNEYMITSIPAPQAGPATVATDGCTGILSCSGFQEPTLTWTSVSPGPQGTYNNFLSCTTGCDTVIVTALPGYPPSVLYQVCGLPFGACASQQVCDTVRVYFVSDKTATIIPQNPVICFGGPPATITATGTGGAPPYSYFWSTGATTQSIVVGPGTYWVQITDTTNCPPVYDTVTVIANPSLIQANAGADDSVCSYNGSFVLNGSVVVATGGIWSGGNGTFSPNNTTLNATYTATQTEIAAGSVTLVLTTTGNGPCPSASDTVVLYIIPAPLAGFTNTTACVNQPTSFTDTSTPSSGNIVSWNWNFGDSGTSSSQNPTHTYVSPGTYTVTLIVVSSSGCSDTIQQNVTVNALPAITATGNINICLGGSTTLTASGGNTYLWSTSATTTAISVSPTTTTTYTVTGTNTTTGCSDTAVITVNVISLPVITISGSPAICIGDNVTLTANGGNTYLWSTSATTAAITVSPAVTTTYTVIGTNTTTGCSDTAVQTITVNPLPVISVTGTSGICLGGSATLTASGGNTYLWSTSATTTSINVSPTTTTTYTVTGTDASTGCSNSTVYTVTVNPLPAGAFSSTAQCYVDSVYFTDNSTISSGSITGWSWNFGDPASGTNDNSSLQNPTHFYATPGTYTVTLIVYSALGCTDTVPLTIVVNPSPLASFSATEVCFGNTTLFSDSSTILFGNITNWNWSFGDAGTATLQNPTHNYTSPGTYSVTLIVTSATGCTDTLIQTVTVHPLPVAAFNSLGACLADGILFNDLSTILAPDSVAQWQWNFGDAGTSVLQNPTHLYPSTGNYGVTLIVTSNFGCTDTIFQAVTVNPSPTAGFIPDMVIVVLNQTVNFTDQSSGAISWFWDFGDSTGTSTQQNPSYAYASGGTYTVMQVVTNQYGCTDTAWYEVIVTMPPKVPSGFSPNGDGKNDILFVLGGPYKKLEFKIYNNWGELIFTSENQADGWDGTRNGQKQPMSVYIYIVYAVTEDNEEHHLKGDVTLLR